MKRHKKTVQYQKFYKVVRKELFNNRAYCTRRWRQIRKASCSIKKSLVVNGRQEDVVRHLYFKILRENGWDLEESE